VYHGCSSANTTHGKDLFESLSHQLFVVTTALTDDLMVDFLLSVVFSEFVLGLTKTDFFSNTLAPFDLE
jgi:hypothetical protein